MNVVPTLGSLKPPPTSNNTQRSKSSPSFFDNGQKNMSLVVEIPRPPDPGLNPAAYLKSIHAVRERSRLIMQRANSNTLNHFDVNMEMFQNTADYVISIIKVGWTRSMEVADQDSEISPASTS